MKKQALAVMALPAAAITSGALAAGEKDRTRGALYGGAGGLAGAIAGAIPATVGQVRRGSRATAAYQAGRISSAEATRRMVRLSPKLTALALGGLVAGTLAGGYGGGRLARKHGREKRVLKKHLYKKAQAAAYVDEMTKVVGAAGWPC